MEGQLEKNKCRGFNVSSNKNNKETNAIFCCVFLMEINFVSTTLNNNFNQQSSSVY